MWLPAALQEHLHAVRLLILRPESTTRLVEELPYAQPNSDISITNPMNWVNNIPGVKNDHSDHRETLKQTAAIRNVTIATGTSPGYFAS